MKVKIKAIFAAAVSVLSFSVYAEPVEGRIERLEVQPNGYSYVYLENVTVPNLGCNNYDKSILQLNTAAPYFKEQYALLLAAFMADRKVKIQVLKCGAIFAYAEDTIALR